MNAPYSKTSVLTALFQSAVKEDLQSLLDCIQDGIFITDGMGNIVACNEASLNFCYMKKEDLLGKNMGDLVTQKVFESSVSMAAIEKRTMVSVIQKGITGKNDLLVTATPFFDKGNISFVVLTERDITELEDLQSSLKSLNEKYAHEINYYRNLFASDIIGESPAMEELLSLSLRIAATNATVLIQGESGTGKSLIAKFIYKNSSRKDKPFIEINCGAIPGQLLESELFGYERGAFTGASEKGKLGLFELAHEGTLFLDEIGTIPFHLQVKILRAIQEKEIMRVGGTKYIPVNIRIISATNSNLIEAVKNGSFRKDLYYRLNICQVLIPPLRSRKEDIRPLCQHFLNKFNAKYQCNKTFSASAWKILCSYPWPGNIRELENIIERIVIICNMDVIAACNISSHFPLSSLGTLGHDNIMSINLKDELDDFEKKLITSKIQYFKTVTELAAALSVDKSTVTRKLKKYNISL